MVKFIGHWMFASRIWNDAPLTPTVINMHEISHIEEMQDINLGVHTIVFLKDGGGIPIDGNTIEIFAEFQKHLQTIEQ